MIQAHGDGSTQMDIDGDKEQQQADDDGGGGIDEAAEALIGLVGGGGPIEEDDQDGGAGNTQRMGPGRVVWAKVEGHDWWPARVVRRRAVPREVSDLVSVRPFQFGAMLHAWDDYLMICLFLPVRSVHPQGVPLMCCCTSRLSFSHQRAFQGRSMRG